MRIISLLPAGTEIVAALGCETLLVGGRSSSYAAPDDLASPSRRDLHSLARAHRLGGSMQCASAP